MSPSGISPESANDSRAVYPCTIHHNGRMGGLNTFYAETSAARLEWKAKLEEAIGLRKVVQESNKVFEIETLSMDTFLVPSMLAGATTPSWSHENSFTGKVTCSVPFCTCHLPCYRNFVNKVRLTAAADRRALVAIGCAEGVWIGYRHDPRCKFIANTWSKPVFTKTFSSNATRTASEDGNPVCYVRGVRHFPCISG